MFVQIKDYPNYSIDEFGRIKSVYVSKLLKPRVAGARLFLLSVKE